MGMLMPLIIKLAKLCIIGFVLIVQGSSGHNASLSPGEVSRFSPTPSMPSQTNESDLHSPPVLPPVMPALAPETTEGNAHLVSPINSEPRPHNTAPPPFTIEERVPSLAPSNPVVLPPSPPPPLVQVHTPLKSPTIEERVPSLAPSNPVVLPPSPPPPLVQVHTPLKSPTTEERVPSLAPSNPVVLPASPPPPLVPVHTPLKSPTIEERVPSLAPSNPVVLPPSSPPPLVQVHAPLMSPTIEERVPSLAPSNPVLLPPSPPPPLVQVHAPLKSPTIEERVPSLAPSNPVVLPPSPPPPLVQVHTPLKSPTIEERVPLLAPSNPVLLPPSPPPPLVQVHAPLKSPTIEEHVPSLAPSNPVVLPPSPPPPLVQVHTPLKSPAIEERMPSLAPSNPVVLPPSPPPTLVQVHTPLKSPTIEERVPSLAPSNPVVLPPSSPPPLVQVHTPLKSPTTEERVPSLAPSNPVVLPPSSPPPLVQVHTPLKSPTAPQKKDPVSNAPRSVPDTPAPVASPSRTSPQNSPDIQPFPSTTPSQNAPESSPVVRLTPVAPPLRNFPQNSPAINSSRSSAFPPIDNRRNSSNNKAPVLEPNAPAPVASRLRNSPQSSPRVHSSRPGTLSPTPSANQENASNSGTPVMEPIAPAPYTTRIKSPRNHTPIPSQGPTALPPRAPIPDLPAPASSPPRKVEMTPPPVRTITPPSISPDPDISPVSNPPSSNDGIANMSPTNDVHKPVPPVNHNPENGSAPAVSPSAPTALRRHSNYLVPSSAPLNGDHKSPAPSTLFHKHQHKRKGRTSPAPASSYLISPPLKQQGPVISPTLLPERKRRHYAPPPLYSVSPSHSFVPSPSPVTASRQTKMPLVSPKVSPSVSPLRSPKVTPPPPLSFPPPPPNADCSTTICTDPYTNTPPGTPCGCVLPMQVGLRLSVALYTFFPLVSELAQEIAVGVFMIQSQVRIMGANAASEQPEKTIVLIDLVPLGDKFENTTAFLTSQRFWHKQVAIKTSLFGDYEVLYVRYLGLPPSPPLPPDVGIIDSGPYPGDNNARAIKPLGVDVHGKRHKHVLSGGVIAIIVLSVLVVVVLFSALAWVLLLKHRDCTSQRAATPQNPQTSLAKPSGSAGSVAGSGLSSISLSFGSSIAAYTGSAKTFTAIEMERATDKFDDSRILGEGGFGLVYRGVLEDGTEVAVKVLKRDDQQGGREFLAEVEMLSRLHHRNLVKLIGICTEERNRSLVYELIRNGSVESHLHGVDKEAAPLGWDARVKIALGAARGLAYLHEDSSPRVIHRDFKSSNILLEYDFTPKVSDFGLARTAMDEEGRHISTRVMGTFGYVAPEYAMTGHLLVKSDVYSYGVVLLELLSGRKPVDMTQPPGQENLVAWARPLLASKEGLESIIDTSLGSNVPLDSVAKVAAIASMCVQPEVSHRPFMGEVVQALKLVCNECDEAKEVGSRASSSQDDFSIDMDGKVGTGSAQLSDPLQSHYSIPNYVSGLDTEHGLSVSDLFSSSARFGRQSSGSFRRQCSSGPLRTGSGSHFWQKIQRLSRGSISEHSVMNKFWSGSH